MTNPPSPSAHTYAILLPLAVSHLTMAVTQEICLVCVLTGLCCRFLANKLSFYLSVSLFLSILYLQTLSLSLSLTLVSSLPMGKSNERNTLPSAFVTGPLLSIIFLLSKDNLGQNTICVVTECHFLTVCLAHCVCRGCF